MIEKIISVLIMLVGAALVYGAKFVASKIKLTKDAENNIMAIKLTGFVIVIISAMIIFVRF